MTTIPLGVDLTLNDRISKQVSQLKARFQGLNNSMDRAFRKTRVSVKRLEKSVVGFAKTFQQNWAIIIGQMFLLRQAFVLFEQSAKFEQQKTAFRNLAIANNANADEIIRKLKEMSGQTLSTAEVMQQASRAMVLGLQADQLPRLMEISRASARAFGEDVDFMFESIVLGIGRQSRMILDNLGIIVKAEDAYEQYARTLGTTAEKLTDMQKRQAFANAVMKAGDKIIADVNIGMKSQLENLQSMKAFWADLKITIGDFFIFFVRGWSAFFNFAMGGIQQLVSGILTLVEAVLEGVQRMVVGLDNIISLIPGIENPLEGINDKINNSKELMNEWSGLTAQVSLDYQTAGDAIIQMMFAQEEAVKSSARLRKAVADIKNEAETLAKKFKEIALQISEGIVDSIGNAFARMLLEGKSFVDEMINAFKQMAIQFIAQVTAMILKWLIFKKLLGGAFGGFFGSLFHKGGLVKKFHEGGAIPRAHDGLAVDEVPIIAQTGEGILSRKGMQALGGAQQLNQLNAGRPVQGGSNNIEITINNPKFNNKQDIRELTTLIGSEIDRQLRYQRGF